MDDFKCPEGWESEWCRGRIRTGEYNSDVRFLLDPDKEYQFISRKRPAPMPDGLRVGDAVDVGAGGGLAGRLIITDLRGDLLFTASDMHGSTYLLSKSDIEVHFRSGSILWRRKP
jgi:hypothetical protein